MQRIGTSHRRVIEILANLSWYTPRRKNSNKPKETKLPPLPKIKRDQVKLSKFKASLERDGIAITNAKGEEMLFPDIKRSITSAKRFVAIEFIEKKQGINKPKKADYTDEEEVFDKKSWDIVFETFQLKLSEAMVMLFDGDQSSEYEPIEPMIYIAKKFDSEAALDGWFKQLSKVQE